MRLSRSIRLLIPKKNINISKNICCTITHRNFPIIRENVKEYNLTALENTGEDLSSVNAHFQDTFNLAAYVNKSELLKNLLQLDVNLSKIEKKPHIVEKILKLDFEENVKKHLFFLKDYVEMQEIGKFISKNPLILCEPLQDLDVRVNYLKSKSFSYNEIKRIITKNPFWLMLSTTRIDRRLGHFQDKFKLSGNEVRLLTSKQPKIITYNLHHVKTNTFVIKEEMGFEDTEVKQLLLHKPKLWMMNQKMLIERFNYLHNIMNIPHSILLQYPEVLLCRNFKVKQRHLFLQKLGRAQYDPKKENYIAVKAIVENTDTEFCKKYAKCNVSDFNTFLKTL